MLGGGGSGGRSWAVRRYAARGAGRWKPPTFGGNRMPTAYHDGPSAPHAAWASENRQSLAISQISCVPIVCQLSQTITPCVLV